MFQRRWEIEKFRKWITKIASKVIQGHRKWNNPWWLWLYRVLLERYSRTPAKNHDFSCPACWRLSP